MPYTYMNFNLSINGESAQELADLGSALSALPTNKKPETKEPVKLEPQEIKEAPAEQQEQATTPATRTRAKATPKVEEPKAEPPKEEKTENLTLETVRAAIQEKAIAGKRDEIKALLKEFGVERATDLKEDQYSEFTNKVKAL